MTIKKGVIKEGRDTAARKVDLCVKIKYFTENQQKLYTINLYNTTFKATRNGQDYRCVMREPDSTVTKVKKNTTKHHEQSSKITVAGGPQSLQCSFTLRPQP